MGYLSAKGPYGYSRGHRLLEVVGIATLFVELAYLAVKVVSGVGHWTHGLGVAVAFGLGYFAADLVSGIAHWAGDTIGTERAPLIGKTFIQPFRNHHVDPLDITRHDFIETNGNNCIVASLTMLHVVLLMPDRPGALYYYGVTMLSLALWTFGTNQFHKWSHLPAERVPPFVRVLQRWGVVLPAEHHQIHHTPPFHEHYCITSGVLNPVLGWLRFFRALERIVAAVAPGLLHVEDRERLSAELASRSVGPALAAAGAREAERSS